MMNYIWSGMIIISFISACITGRMAELSNAILQGASNGITLVITMCGAMCFWTGLIKIADVSGVTRVLTRVLTPLLIKLFPDYKDNEKAKGAICGNIVANLLGLGNAATPLGINAMKEMSKTNPLRDTANNSMVMFVVINTASIQLIPTTVAMLRQSYGSNSPFDILPCIWITSIISLVFGIIMAKLLGRKSI